MEILRHWIRNENSNFFSLSFIRRYEKSVARRRQCYAECCWTAAESKSQRFGRMWNCEWKRVQHLSNTRSSWWIEEGGKSFTKWNIFHIFTTHSFTSLPNQHTKVEHLNDFKFSRRIHRIQLFRVLTHSRLSAVGSALKWVSGREKREKIGRKLYFVLQEEEEKTLNWVENFS